MKKKFCVRMMILVPAGGREGEREGGREGETECVHPCKKNLGFRYFWKVRSFWTKITIDAIG